MIDKPEDKKCDVCGKIALGQIILKTNRDERGARSNLCFDCVDDVSNYLNKQFRARTETNQ